MTRGVVTGAPLGSYSTHSSPVPYSPTRLAFAPLSPFLSLHYCLSISQFEAQNERISQTHAFRGDFFYGERERGGQQADANFLFGFFSFLPPCSRGGVRFDRTQETVNRSLAVRVPVISRLRDTGTDGSHCILIPRRDPFFTSIRVHRNLKESFSRRRIERERLSFLFYCNFFLSEILRLYYLTVG